MKSVPIQTIARTVNCANYKAHNNILFHVMESTVKICCQYKPNRLFLALIIQRRHNLFSSSRQAQSNVFLLMLLGASSAVHCFQLDQVRDVRQSNKNYRRRMRALMDHETEMKNEIIMDGKGPLPRTLSKCPRGTGRNTHCQLAMAEAEAMWARNGSLPPVTENHVRLNQPPLCSQP
ncbi:hypothetical protein BaRGS_00000063 [Batillaria attramentaria]|uniref:Uncharacterized protein n=1 Tax=Batillaria attramentaria TaxID=370345 RepID=A0ABD0MAZ7_9CAEN